VTIGRGKRDPPRKEKDAILLVRGTEKRKALEILLSEDPEVSARRRILGRQGTQV